MAKGSGTTRRTTPRTQAQQPRVAPPRFAVGRVAPRTAEERANRPLRPSVESGAPNAASRIDTSWKMFPRAIRNAESLDKIKDPAVYREVRRAISRFHSVLGVRETNFVLADLADNRIAADYHRPGGSAFIVLNKKFFNKSKKELLKEAKGEYTSGWHTKTNKPLAHSVTHELSHALWVPQFSSDRHKAAGKEIRALRRRWLKDPDRAALGYGTYSTKNVAEFWAELVTKAVHGKSDKYTEAAKEIIKRHKL